MVTKATLLTQKSSRDVGIQNSMAGRVMSDFDALTDVEMITKVADSLGISEFKLFESAYADWHKRNANERELELYFVRYLFYRQAPTWVRHYARNKEHELGLNEAAYRSVPAFCIVNLLLYWKALIRCALGLTGKDAVLAA